ncbi:MAG: rRNA maturation RNase YbeY [Hyphomicrobium sp.]
MSERRPRPRAKLTVDIIEDDGNWAFVEDVQSLIEAAAAEVATEPLLKVAQADVVVVLSCDANVAILNGQYRGKPKPTNVLSFPAGQGAPPGQLGDIVLACETVQREADSEDIPVEHHLQHLVVHGLLHLLGLDHASETDAERMEALEIKILARLGIANPYMGPLDTVRS